MIHGSIRRIGLRVGAGALLALGLLLVAAVILQQSAPVVEDILDARDLPFTLTEWEAWHALPPDESNAAPLLLQAVDALPADEDSAIALLIEAASYDGCRFELPASSPREETLRLYADLRALNDTLRVRCDHALSQGDGDTLALLIEAMLFLAFAAMQHPDFFGYYTASAMVLQPLEKLSNALSAGLLDLDAINRIDSHLARLEDPELARRAVLGGMATAIHHGGDSPDLDAVMSRIPGLFRAWVWTSIPARLQAVYARDHLRAHDILALPYAEQRASLAEWEYTTDTLISAIEQFTRFPYYLARIGDPDYFVTGMALHQGRMAAARGALNVERYRIAHENLPESADQLSQTGLPLPGDPLGDGPIRYALDGDGSYRTWSIGLNQLDNGGYMERYAGPDLVFRVVPSLVVETVAVEPVASEGE